MLQLVSVLIGNKIDSGTENGTGIGIGSRIDTCIGIGTEANHYTRNGIGIDSATRISTATRKCSRILLVLELVLQSSPVVGRVLFLEMILEFVPVLENVLEIMLLVKWSWNC